MKSWFQKLHRSFTHNPWLFYGLMVLLTAPAFLFDWDILRVLARLDERFEGNFIDEIASLVLILIVATAMRRAALLRGEVARRREAEAVALSLARHDPLTGLANRRRLQEVLAEALAEHDARTMRALMIVDLDGFKPVNDLHGHPFGDALLCQVVARLRAIAGERFTLARLGGDEFAMLLPAGSSRQQVARVADRIVRRIAEPFDMGGRQISVGASVGIACSLGDGDTPATLLRAADLALYRAKAAGRGCYRFFEPDMDRAVREQVALQSELRQALATGQIVPFYQPTIDLATGAVDGLEVLARWQHPTRGLLSPDLFIPLAEDQRLMSVLTLALFRLVCRDARQWPEHCRIAINMSPSQLYDADLVGQISAVIADAGLRPSRFEIEVTETALIGDVVTARAVIDQLHAAGLTVALDDFGSGYSSLYHLREIPFDKVKIDKSFVRGITRRPMAARYVEAIVRLVISLNLELTAEGIEEPGVRDVLAELGCTFGQGFLFSPPIAADEVGATLARLAMRQTALAAAA
ncbi:MAG: EAL domain-containing protein [Acetobacteraceae bacterium]